MHVHPCQMWVKTEIERKLLLPGRAASEVAHWHRVAALGYEEPRSSAIGSVIF